MSNRSLIYVLLITRSLCHTDLDSAEHQYLHLYCSCDDIMLLEQLLSERSQTAETAVLTFLCSD